MAKCLTAQPRTTVIEMAETLLASLIVTAMVVLHYRLLANQLGQDEFAAFTLAKRSLSIVFYTATLGSALAITKVLAGAIEPDRRSTYIVSGFIVAVIPSIAFAFVVYLFADTAALWIYDDRKYANLVQAQLVLLIGQAVSVFLYSVLRGRMDFRAANVWLVYANGVSQAIAAGVTILPRFANAHTAIALSAIPLFVAIGFVAGIMLREPRRETVRFRPVMAAGREILKYGLPRMPSSVAFYGLFALAPLLAIRHLGVTSSGLLVSAQSIFQVIEGLTYALGFVLFPKMVSALSTHIDSALAEKIRTIVSGAVAIGAYLGIHCVIWADVLIYVFLGPQYVSVVPIMRIMCAAIWPYTMFSLLRPVIDATDPKPLNVFNILIAIGVQALIVGVAALASLGIASYAIGVTSSIFVLGILTLVSIGRRWTSSIALRETTVDVAAIAAMAFIVLILRELTTMRNEPAELIVAAIAIECLSLAAMYLYCMRCSPRWFRQMSLRVATVKQ